MKVMFVFTKNIKHDTGSVKHIFLFCGKYVKYQPPEWQKNFSHWQVTKGTVQTSYAATGNTWDDQKPRNELTKLIFVCREIGVTL